MAHPAVVVSAPSDASLVQHYPAHLSAPASTSQSHFHAPPRFTLDGHGSSASSDSEDDDEQEAGEEAYTPPSSNHEHALNPTSRAHKDAARREHALRELVDTELAYVADLRMLVEVYLPRLPTILVPDARVIARNSQQLLSLHIELADAFEATSVVQEFSISSVDAAIAAVAGVLVSFRDRLCALYDEFCEGHRAASDAVKRADARPEFAAFEKACAAHGLDNTDRSPTDAPVGESSTLAAVTPSTDPQPASSSMMMTPTDEPAPALQHSHSDPVPAPIEIRQPSSTRLSILKPRRHSLGAADAHTTPKLTPKPFTKGHASSGSTSSTGDRRPALRFSDYLIKPVQRICRYQLLLAQLVPVGTAADTSAPASVALQSALRTARRAADIADEASRRADAVARTALINMRIAASSASTLGFGGRAQAQGNGAGALPKDFLDSLGPVRFAGSLDVVYVPPQLAQTQEDEPSESVSRTPSSKSLGGGSSPSSSPGGSSASSLGRLASSRRKRLSTLGMTALTSSAADGGEASTSRAAAALAGAGSSRSALRSSPRGSGRKRDGKRRHLGVFVYDGGFVVMVKVLRHKVYEPRHWFALTPACVVAEIVPEEASDDFAFEITTGCGHTFTCFASGDREQTLWIDNLAEARSAPPRWAPEDARCSLSGGASGLPGSTVASPESYTIPLPPDFPGLEALEMESAAIHGLGQSFVLEREATVSELPTLATTPHGTMARRTTTKRNSLPASGGSVTRAERGLDDVLSSTYAQARNHARINGGHAREGTGSTLKDREDSLTRSPSSSSVTPSPISMARRPPLSRPGSSGGDGARNTTSGASPATTGTVPSLAGSREISTADLVTISLNSPGRSPQHSPSGSRPSLRHEPASNASHASSTMSSDTAYSRTTVTSVILTTSASASSFAGRRSKSRSNSDPRRPVTDEPAPQLPAIPLMGPVGPLHRVGGVLGPQLDTLFAAAPTPPAEEPLLEEREDGYTWGSPPRSPGSPLSPRMLSGSPKALSSLGVGNRYLAPEDWEIISPARENPGSERNVKKMRRTSLRLLFSPRHASSRPSTAEGTPTRERMAGLVETPDGSEDREIGWLSARESTEFKHRRRSNVTETRSEGGSSSKRSSTFYPPGPSRSVWRQPRVDVEPDTRPLSASDSVGGWWASLRRRVKGSPDPFRSSVSTPHVNLSSAPPELLLSPTGLTSSPALRAQSQSPAQDHLELPSENNAATPSPKPRLWKRNSLRVTLGADLLRSSSVSLSSFRRLAGGAHNQNGDDANQRIRPQMPSPSPSFTPSTESGTTGSDPAVVTPSTDEGFLSAFRANSALRARSDDGHGESYAFTELKERRLSRGLSMLSSLKRVTPLEAEL